jgi:hypothetical protein
MSTGASGQPRNFGKIDTHAVPDLGYGKNRKPAGKQGAPKHKPPTMPREAAAKPGPLSKGKAKKKDAKA